MRSNRLISAVAIAGLTVLSANAPALEPGTDFSKMLHPTGVIPLPESPQDLTANQVVCTNDAECDNGEVCDGVETWDVGSGQCLDGVPPCAEGCVEPGGTCIPFNDDCPSVNLGVIAASGGSFSGDTTDLADDFDVPNGCGGFPGGRDQVFGFQLEEPGGWRFHACFSTSWQKKMTLWEDDGTCPGTFIACAQCGCASCQPLISEFLAANTTYYLIVDGKRASDHGDLEVLFSQFEPACSSDVDCDDGLFCTGEETCEPITGECFNGLRPCRTYQGLPAPCDEENQTCIDVDPCITWRAGAGGPYFSPQVNLCPGIATWVFDDIQTSKHTSQILDWYTTPLIARSTVFGASPLGTTYSVDQALWTVEDFSCNPLSIISGSRCSNSGVVAPGGAPPDVMRCAAAMPALPNNDGDFNRCEVDFFIAYRTAENGAGLLFPREHETIGGPGARDEFGMDQFWFEGCPPNGIFSPVFCRGGCGVIFGLAEAEVCQKPAAVCCQEDGSCAVIPPEECTGIDGAVGTISDGPASCGGDPDEDGILAACDNCPDDFNPDQGDCDGDGEGDACEADEADQDDDGDGVCNGIDNCPLNPDPNQDDTDGDGAGDPCDPCPVDPNDDSDGDGVCDSADQCPGGDDRLDDDLDGVPDGCDLCPGSDDNVPGAGDDADGDGVLNCNDRCPSVDDAVFGPECEGAIPTTSQWGLIVLTLLLLAGGKILFGIHAKRVARS